MIESVDMLTADKGVHAHGKSKHRETSGKVLPAFSETSFDSGYSTSPAKFTQGFSHFEAVGNSVQLTRFAAMDEHKVFINSPVQSPYKTKLDDNVHAGYLQMSPLKTEPIIFSPFKESVLSPFKLINQSPSKGTFDDWDKDFIASFEENLFGGMNDLSENLVEELLKSPQGKAMLERRNSPLRMTGHSAVRKLKISPQTKPIGRDFQSLDSGFSNNVFTSEKSNPLDEYIVKKEDIQADHLYGQTFIYVNTNNALSAIDPNKMSATPIKPRLTNIEAPKRKLAMKAPCHSGTVQALLFQKENQFPTINVQETEDLWPSKEKLKYARIQFTKVLNSAVEKELELLRVEKEKKESLSILKKKHVGGKESRNQGSEKNRNQLRKVTGGKVVKNNGGKSKGKVSRKAGKKAKYPEIQKALSKPSLGKGKSCGLERQLFPPPSTQYVDPGFYPDDGEEEEQWTGPPPFYSQMSTEFYEDNSSSDEDWDLSSGFKFETITGNRVAVKRRKKY